MSSLELQVIFHPDLSPGYNMAVDWWLFNRVSRPTIRFYGWSRPALSIGYSQQYRVPDKLNQLIDKFPVVIRPTGGGWLLHAGDLTFSLIVPVGHRLFDQTIRGFYRLIRERLEKLLGIDSQQPVEQDFTGAGLVSDCLGTCGVHEPSINGKKWLVSAQLRNSRAVIQQISLFLDSRAWPQTTGISKPFFLDQLDSRLLKANLRAAIIRDFQNNIFGQTSTHIRQFTAVEWKQIARSVSCFRLDCLQDLPKFSPRSDGRLEI